MALAQPNYASQEIAVFSRVGKNCDLRDKEKGISILILLRKRFTGTSITMYHYGELQRSSQRTRRLWRVDFFSGLMYLKLDF